MDMMIADRLSYKLEKKGMLASHQSGFRMGRNPIDSVIRLETEIRNTKSQGKQIISSLFVFFDKEKAYFMIGIVNQIALDGDWWKSFLLDKGFSVRKKNSNKGWVRLIK